MHFDLPHAFKSYEAYLREWDEPNGSPHKFPEFAFLYFGIPVSEARRFIGLQETLSPAKHRELANAPWPKEEK